MTLLNAAKLTPLLGDDARRSSMHGATRGLAARLTRNTMTFQ
ncbi:MAG: hypothetical protein KatS3mg111_0731 [Pirellulaceae bacterium]|nr:MAG: hypothetical protein KatS3mg111_0731 [Pirellulaceae bacterium]